MAQALSKSWRLAGLAFLLVLGMAALLVFARSGRSASEILEKYVFLHTPDSVEVIDFKLVGRREWTAFIHFRTVASDMSLLLEQNNAVRLDPATLHPDDSSAFALNMMNSRARDYGLPELAEFYVLRNSETILESYLGINGDHSVGYIFVHRF